MKKCSIIKYKLSYNRATYIVITWNSCLNRYIVWRMGYCNMAPLRDSLLLHAWVETAAAWSLLKCELQFFSPRTEITILPWFYFSQKNLYGTLKKNKLTTCSSDTLLALNRCYSITQSLTYTWKSKQKNTSRFLSYFNLNAEMLNRQVAMFHKPVVKSIS